MNHESDLMNHGFSEEDIVRLRASSAKTGTEMDTLLNDLANGASSEVSVDTVTKVYQKGFRLEDLVLRSAKVRVSRPPSGAGRSRRACASSAARG